MEKLKYVILIMMVTIFLLMVFNSAFAQDTDHVNKRVRPFLQKMESGKDSVDLNLYFMIKDFEKIALNAYQYFIRPKSMGGGEHSYAHYRIPSPLVYSLEGKYSADVYPTTIKIRGESRHGYGNISATTDTLGNLLFLAITGRLNDKLQSN